MANSSRNRRLSPPGAGLAPPARLPSELPVRLEGSGSSSVSRTSPCSPVYAEDRLRGGAAGWNPSATGHPTMGRGCLRHQPGWPSRKSRIARRRRRGRVCGHPLSPRRYDLGDPQRAHRTANARSCPADPRPCTRPRPPPRIVFARRCPPGFAARRRVLPARGRSPPAIPIALRARRRIARSLHLGPCPGLIRLVRWDCGAASQQLDRPARPPSR